MDTHAQIRTLLKRGFRRLLNGTRNKPVLFCRKSCARMRSLPLRGYSLLEKNNPLLPSLLSRCSHPSRFQTTATSNSPADNPGGDTPVGARAYGQHEIGSFWGLSETSRKPETSWKPVETGWCPGISLATRHFHGFLCVRPVLLGLGFLGCSDAGMRASSIENCSV